MNPSKNDQLAGSMSKVYSEALSRCSTWMKENIQIYDRLKDDKLHRLWNRGVVATWQVANIRACLEAEGSRHIILKNPVNGMDFQLKSDGDSIFFDHMLVTALKHDNFLYDVKANLICMDLEYYAVQEGCWTVKFYNDKNELVGLKRLRDAEYFQEALEDYESMVEEKVIDFKQVS